LAATLVVTEAGHFVALTLAPLKALRLMGRGPRALWETRVHESDREVRVGLASAPGYMGYSMTEAEALARHEALVARLEAGTFETETGREILGSIRPLVRRGVELFRSGDHRGAVAALEEAIRAAERVDAVHHFMHLYQEAFLLRALVLESIDPDAAKAAYRDFIRLYAGSPSPHPEVLRGVARAREAVERLTPVPHESRFRDRLHIRGGGREESV
jgi:hypothetical protein